MFKSDQITFVVAVNNHQVLRQNLLASPILDSAGEVLIQEGFPSAALAYNDALRKATNDLIVFIHQDVFLPKPWFEHLKKTLQHLDQTDPEWGILGCWGARADGSLLGHVYSSGWGVLGTALMYPTLVQTLDEIVLICRRGSGLAFDENLPYFHLYGTDICMRAAVAGRNCYVMSNLCIHNTRQLLRLPKEFYECYGHVKRTWRSYLPIQTSCIRISRFDSEMCQRRLRDFCRPTFLDSRKAVSRVPDPYQIWRELNYSGGDRSRLIL